MSLERELFPDPKASNAPNWIQTEWAEGWAAQFMGIGYLTGLVNRHFHELGALQDQAGLAAVFLQRHRLEVGIKTVFAALEDERTDNHNLTTLWAECKKLVGQSTDFVPHGFTGQEVVDTHLKPHDELIRLMSKADPGSFTFRYPVDKGGKKVDRPKFIDYAALERVCEEFEGSVIAIVETLEA